MYAIIKSGGKQYTVKPGDVDERLAVGKSVGRVAEVGWLEFGQRGEHGFDEAAVLFGGLGPRLVADDQGPVC